jgi:hypothetical protein
MRPSVPLSEIRDRIEVPAARQRARIVHWTAPCCANPHARRDIPGSPVLARRLRRWDPPGGRVMIAQYGDPVFESPTPASLIQRGVSWNWHRFLT